MFETIIWMFQFPMEARLLFYSFLIHPEDHRCYITAVHAIIWGDNMFEMSCKLLIDIISTYLL